MFKADKKARRMNGINRTDEQDEETKRVVDGLAVRGPSARPARRVPRVVLCFGFRFRL